MFLEWLLKQNFRKDQVGWLSRTISSSEKSKDELKPLAGSKILKKYADNFPTGKIKSALLEAHSEWIKVAYGPKVGIFWIINGEIVSFSQEATSVVPVAGFIDGVYDHSNMWSTVQRMFPQTKMQQYITVPRGRVLGIDSIPRRYRIFLPPEMSNDTALISKVIREFNLPQNATEVVGDEHYSLEDLNLDPFDEDYDPFEDDDNNFEHVA